jgi:hypothetical protein
MTNVLGRAGRDTAYLTLGLLTSNLGVAAVTLVAGVLGAAVLPAWYWAIPDGIDFGL